MRVVSFNVNGLRAFAKKAGGSFNDYVRDILQADILCIQEIKGTSGSLDGFHALVDYQTFSSFHEVRGRHGVSTLVGKGLFCDKTEEIDKGRILKTYHGNFVVYNCYMPFSDGAESEMERVKITYDLLRKALSEHSPLQTILCGDLNACYNMMDHYQYLREYERLCGSQTHWQPEGPALDPEKNTDGFVEKSNPNARELPYQFFNIESLSRYFFSTFQRDWLRNVTEKYADTFRLFNHNLREYTCWNTFLGNRPANLGTRIDYILCSKDAKCTESGIMQNIMGSDHCPVFAVFEIQPYSAGSGNLLARRNNLLEFFKKK